MKSAFMIFIILITFGITCPLSIAASIEIKNKSCEYTIQIPIGWDTIPKDTLNCRFGVDRIDIGLFNINETYFEGKFVLYIFLPTVKSLNNFSFKQITKDFEGKIAQPDNQANYDSTNMITHEFRASEIENCFYMNGSIKSELKERDIAQIIVPTKFGFLKIIYYSSLSGAKDANGISMQDMFANTKIDKNYLYTEPASDSKLSIWHFTIAIGIGLVVFAIIQYAPLLKQLLLLKS